MPNVVSIGVACRPGDESEECLRDIFWTLARANARLFARNKHWPCCVKCAGAKYDPDGGRPRVPGYQHHRGAHEVIRDGVVSCFEASAYDAGKLMAADEFVDVNFEQVARGDGPGDDRRHYHVTLTTDKGHKDPTEKLDRL